MATKIDITSKIRNDKKILVYQGKEYPVDASKNAVTEVMAILSSVDDGNMVESIEKAMVRLLGEEAAKDFDGLDFIDYRCAFTAVTALATGKSFEETEELFR